MMQLTAILLLIVFIVTNASDSGPKVKTPIGKIKGYYKKSDNNRVYEAYEGIPYALPPVGQLRFEPPSKILSWVGELQATKHGEACLQYAHIPEKENERVEGGEDCLYLNVYVPTREKKAPPMPVIFWIHGGCFQYGAGSLFGAKFLADSDVILVTVNYRVGPLGFLSTEDDVVSGNMGLKDQSMALRWVYDNIQYFGGDPNKITLTGLSAGGASVHYHYLSPLSSGLFQNGISFSGTSMLCWTQTEKPLERAKKLAALMGCPSDKIKEMIECLKSRPAKPIVQATSEFMPWIYNPFTPFGPVVEKTKSGYFINRTPAEIIRSGDVEDVPWITGVVSEEGLYPAADFVANEERLKYLNENWNEVAKYLLDFNYTIPVKKHAQVASTIRQHYFGSKPIDKTTIHPLIKLVGDRIFVVDAEKAARLQAKSNKSPVWFYYYSYRAAQSLSDIMSGTKENFGVCHADDTYLVIDQHYIDPTTNKKDRAMQKDLLKFWISVATKGVPDFGVEWPPVDPNKENFNYLHISGPGKFTMEYNSNLGEKNLWSSIDFDENKIAENISGKKEEL